MGWVVVVLAVVVALLVHRRFPWIPLPYLVALIALPVGAWRLARWRHAPRPVRWAGATVAVLSFVALCPVPWMKAQLDHPPGSAWRLDGRLVINGETVDPPGSWYWLTAGRPPVVAEVVRGWVLAGGDGRADEHARRPASAASGGHGAGGGGRGIAPGRLADQPRGGRRGRQSHPGRPARHRRDRRRQRRRGDEPRRMGSSDRRAGGPEHVDARRRGPPRVRRTAAALPAGRRDRRAERRSRRGRRWSSRPDVAGIVVPRPRPRVVARTDGRAGVVRVRLR